MLFDACAAAHATEQSLAATLPDRLAALFRPHFEKQCREWRFAGELTIFSRRPSGFERLGLGVFLLIHELTGCAAALRPMFLILDRGLDL